MLSQRVGNMGASASTICHRKELCRARVFIVEVSFHFPYYVGNNREVYSLMSQLVFKVAFQFDKPGLWNNVALANKTPCTYMLGNRLLKLHCQVKP